MRSALIAAVMCLGANRLLSQAPGVAPQPGSQPADIYRNFAGEWEGIGRNPVDGEISVHISIKEDVKKDRMEWHTTYGVKGLFGLERRDRYVTLMGAKNLVVIKLKEPLYTYNILTNYKDSYASADLADFAKTGYGTFNASSIRPDELGRWFRLKLSLSRDALSYTWEVSRDRTTFQPYGSFELERVNWPARH